VYEVHTPGPWTGAVGHAYLRCPMLHACLSPCLEADSACDLSLGGPHVDSISGRPGPELLWAPRVCLHSTIERLPSLTWLDLFVQLQESSLPAEYFSQIG
jgi:hypothetical protein